MFKVEEKSIMGCKRNSVHITALPQYHTDACCEQTCKGVVQLGPVVKQQQQQEEEKDGESWEAGGCLSKL